MVLRKARSAQVQWLQESLFQQGSTRLPLLIAVLKELQGGQNVRILFFNPKIVRICFQIVRIFILENTPFF